MCHVADGCLDKGNGIACYGIGQSCREELLHPVHEFVHTLGSSHGIGAFGQLYAYGCRRCAVEARVDGIALAAHFHPGHVADADCRSVGIDTDQDVAELLDCLQLDPGEQGYIDFLSCDGREAAQLSHGYLLVLLLYGGNHVVRGEAVA